MCDDVNRRAGRREVLYYRLAVGQFGQRDQLTINVDENHLTRNRFRTPALRLSEVITSDLNQIVQQQAERKLKDRPLRRAADQSLCACETVSTHEEKAEATQNVAGASAA